MNTASTVILSVFASSAVVGLFELILKLAIKNTFEKEMQRFTNGLTHESEKASIRLTKDLERQAAMDSIKLAELFKRQADAIKAVHNRLFHLYGASLAYDRVRLVNIPNAEQKFTRELFDKTFEDFRVDLIEHVIYLPNETRLKIESVISAILKKNIYFDSLEKAVGVTRANSGELQQFDKAILEINAQLPSLLNTLREDMQNILGVAKKTTSSDQK